MAKSKSMRGAVKPTAGEQHDIVVGAVVIILIVLAVNFIVRSRNGIGASMNVGPVSAGAELQAAINQQTMVPSDQVNATRTPGLVTEQLSATSDDGRYDPMAALIGNGFFAIGNNVPLSSN